VVPAVVVEDPPAIGIPADLDALGLAAETERFLAADGKRSGYNRIGRNLRFIMNIEKST
jgi:hypothetical protein